MANITDKIASIRSALFGRDVRESIASGLEAMNSEIENFIDTNACNLSYLVGDKKIILDNKAKTLSILDGCYCVVPDQGILKLNSKVIDISSLNLNYVYILYCTNEKEPVLSLYSANIPYNANVLGVLYNDKFTCLNSDVVTNLNASGTEEIKIPNNTITSSNIAYAEVSLLNSGVTVDFNLMKVIIKPNTFVVRDGAVFKLNQNLSILDIPTSVNTSTAFLIHDGIELKCIDRSELRTDHLVIVKMYAKEVSGINKDEIEVIGSKSKLNNLESLTNSIRNPFELTNLKILGDSITAGVGGSGYNANGGAIGKTGKLANEDGYCWANEVKKHLEKFNKETLVNPNYKKIYYSAFNISPTYDINALLGWRCVLDITDTYIYTNFYGDSIDIYYTAITNGGIVKVEVDGVVKATIDTYSETNTYSQKYTLSGLELGKHDLKLIVSGKNSNSSNYHFSFEGLGLVKHLRVKNWGISGWNSNNMYTYRSSLVEDDDTHILCQIGTNDRISDRGFTKGENVTYAFMNECIKYWNNLGKGCILSVASPADLVNEEREDYNFTMGEVHKTVFSLGADNNAYVINNYQCIFDYCLYKDIDLADISSIIGDRLHPNDKGYKVMFNNVMKELKMPIFIKRGE